MVARFKAHQERWVVRNKLGKLLKYFPRKIHVRKFLWLQGKIVPWTAHGVHDYGHIYKQISRSDALCIIYQRIEGEDPIVPRMSSSQFLGQDWIQHWKDCGYCTTQGPTLLWA